MPVITLESLKGVLMIIGAIFQALGGIVGVKVMYDKEFPKEKTLAEDITTTTDEEPE